MSADQRLAVIDRQMQIATDPLVPVALQVMAAKNLLTASMVNLKAAETLLKVQALAAVEAIATRDEVATDTEIAGGLNKLLESNARPVDEPAGGHAGSTIPIESWKINSAVGHSS